MKNLFFYLILALIILSSCTKEGIDGNNSLLDIIPVDAGGNCSAGGYKIVSGLDLNDNNILDASEIQNIEYICNGGDGMNGYNSLVNVIEESVGENCSSGGLKIESGIDLNNNDVLDGNEIQNVQFVCNGDDGINGYNSLVNVIDEPAGENCSSGGYKIESGIDLNNNNTLDEDEVQNTEYICNGNLDKEILFNLLSNFSCSLSSIRIYSVDLPYLDITTFENLSSVTFVATGIKTTDYLRNDMEGEVTIELFDLTNYKVIQNSKLKTDNIASISSQNLIDYIPNEKIKLGIRLSGSNGLYFQSNNIYMVLSRE